jgi:ribosome biogenesis GTPase
MVILNKTDLAAPTERDAFEATYRACGYEVVATCASTGRGLEALEKLIVDGVYAFVGESGVGKSSLINRLDPKVLQVTQEVGERTQRGRHTTTSSQLFPFRSGFLADTPGMQTFGFPGRDESELAACFPEFAHVDSPCRFNPCTHSHEPSCGVKAAVAAGAIASSRYDSFLAIMAEIRTHMKDQSW